MSKHTPGPWTINAHNDLISDKDGNILAYLRCTKTTSVGNGWLPMEANARLMAAAPELLEFVRYVAKGIPVGDDPCSLEELEESLDHLEERAKRLIEKIEGYE